MPARTVVEREGEPDNTTKFEELFNDNEAFADDRKKRVGGYILGRTLGEGSFAKVRIGTHIATNEKVAVKVINKKMVMKREYVRKNMRREAVMMQRLSHPNVVQLIEVMETENSFYMVTELAEGGDFMKYLTDRNSINENLTRKFMRQIVSAVDHMHRSGVLHRDMKIENLLLDADMNMKIIDFGLSNHWDGETLLATQCGSPAYAAPEIFGKQNYGPEVDVWSMGINMYAMLTGRLPFLVDPPNNLQKLHALILRGAKIPDFLTKDCQDLLGRLLEPSECKRITIEEILQHPWLNEGVMPLDPWGLKVKPHPDEINTEVVWYMVKYLNVTEENVRDSVTNFKPNATTGNYFILCQRLRRGHGLPNGVKYPNSQKLSANQSTRRSLRQSKNSINKEGTMTTIVANSDPKRTVPKAEVHIHPPNEMDSSHIDTEYHIHVPNGHTNGYTEPSAENGNGTEEAVYVNFPNAEVAKNTQQNGNGIVPTYTGTEQVNGTVAHEYSQSQQVPQQPYLQPQQYPHISTPNGVVPGIQREKASSTYNSGANTARDSTPVNQQVTLHDINTVYDNIKRGSLPDIPVEVGLTPRSTFRESMRSNNGSKKKRPKRERGILKPQDKSSSVPDHLNVMGSSYKQKPGHLADSIALRNATRYKYRSKPEDMQQVGRHSRPEGLNHIHTQPYYVSQTLTQPQHCTMDPATVLHGTHQFTPAEHAQLDNLRAREILQKQTTDGYDYPSTPPTTVQTPRRYGYSNGGGNKYVTVRDRTQMWEAATNNGMDERDRARTVADFDQRRNSTVESHRMNGAHSKENVNTPISNVGYYSIQTSHSNQQPQSRARPQHGGTHRADPTKYQSPFVRRDSKRYSGRASKDVVHEFLTPRTRKTAGLAQVVSTPR